MVSFERSISRRVQKAFSYFTHSSKKPNKRRHRKFNWRGSD